MVHIPLIKDNKDTKQLSASIAIFRRKVLTELNSRADIESVNSYYAACKAIADRCRDELKKAGVEVPEIKETSLITSHSPSITVPMSDDMDLTALNTVMRDLRASMDAFSVRAGSEMANMMSGMESLLVSTESVEDSGAVEDMRDDAASLVGEALSEGLDIAEVFDQALKDADQAIKGAEGTASESASNFGGMAPPSTEEPDMMRERVENVKESYDDYLEAEGEYNQAKEVYDSLVDDYEGAEEQIASLQSRLDGTIFLIERETEKLDELKTEYDDANRILTRASRAHKAAVAATENPIYYGKPLNPGQTATIRQYANITNKGDGWFDVLVDEFRDDIEDALVRRAGLVADDPVIGVITGHPDVDEATAQYNEYVTQMLNARFAYEKQEEAVAFLNAEADSIRAEMAEVKERAERAKELLPDAEKAMNEAEERMREAADTIASNL